MALKSYLPKTGSDWFAMVFMVIMVHVIPLFELIIILPYIDSHARGTWWIHFLVGIFIYVNVMVSFVKTIITDTTSGNLVLPSILKPGWRFCSVCEANSPPRSLHCYFCNQCILKRDHHCMFTGNCIGHSNQRYFITMIFYVFVGAVYCNFLNIDYTWELLGDMTIKSLFTMIMPIFAYMLGLTPSYTFGVAFISSTCVLGLFLMGALLTYHLINAYNGQITHERSHRVREYNLGWKENFRHIMGDKWYIAWLSPIIESNLPGNGVEFLKRKCFEDVKDM